MQCSNAKRSVRRKMKVLEWCLSLYLYTKRKEPFRGEYGQELLLHASLCYSSMLDPFPCARKGHIQPRGNSDFLICILLWRSLALSTMRTWGPGKIHCPHCATSISTQEVWMLSRSFSTSQTEDLERFWEKKNWMAKSILYTSCYKRQHLLWDRNTFDVTEITSFSQKRTCTSVLLF